MISTEHFSDIAAKHNHQVSNPLIGRPCLGELLMEALQDALYAPHALVAPIECNTALITRNVHSVHRMRLGDLLNFRIRHKPVHAPPFLTS
jgi:hypothetical protein